MKPAALGTPVLWSTVGVLAVAAVAQVVYVARLREDLDDISQQLADARAAQPESAPAAAPRWAPRHVPSSDPGEPESRDADATGIQPLVRALVVEELERREWEKEARKSARSEDAYTELGDSLVHRVGASRGDADRVEQILVSAREARQDLRRAERNRELSTQEATDSLAALRTATQQQLAEILGQDWVTKLEQTREDMRDARRKQRDARGSGGVFWFMPRERGD